MRWRRQAASRSEPQGSDAGYLVSAAMVAAVIIGVFFGAGFYLLAQPTAQIIGGSGPRGGIEITALHSIVFPDLPSGAQSVSVEVELPSSAAVTSLPALTQSSPTAREDPTPGNTNPGRGSASPAAEAAVSIATVALSSAEAPAATSAASVATRPSPATVSPPEPASGLPVATTPTMPSPSPPLAPEIAELLARGDYSSVVVRDIALARVFYERAANAEDGRAAVRMGATFDPAFHSLAGRHRTFAHPAHARSWYRRDLDLGGAGVIQAQSTGTVTAICKDGTSFTGTKRYGACRGHGGVQSWGEAPAAISPANLPAVQPAPTASRRTAPAPAGPGQVWVNTASKVYHCPGTRWYGKTQQGSFMSEAQAQAAGARQDHGKACTS
jgi:hypothetical protein